MRLKLLLAALVVLPVSLGVTAWAQQGFKATPVLKSTTTVSGQKIAYPKTDKPEISSLLLEIEPGGESGLHMHPNTTYVHVLEGTLTVQMGDGSTHDYQAGQAFLEIVGAWHNGKNMGKAPVKVLVVFTGEEGKPNLVRPEKK